MFLEEEGPELKAEKAENDGGGGVDVGRAPLALLSCVMEDSKAGPGISGVSTLAVLCQTINFSATHWCCCQILGKCRLSGQNCCRLLTLR